MQLIKAMTKKKNSNVEKSGEIPVSAKMLYGVRDELKYDISSFEHRLESRFKNIDVRFDKIDARFEKMEARFDTLESKIQRMIVLAEDQRNQNRYIFDKVNISTHNNEIFKEQVTDQIEDIKTVISLHKST